MEALYWMYAATDSRPFWPLHQIARKTYTDAFTPAFERWLQWRTAIRDLRLVVRNSAASGAGFNVFGSDIDYAALIPEDSRSEKIAKLFSEYHALRNQIRAIGELEIYTQREWQMREALERESGPCIQLIRAIRKIGWQETAYKKAKNRYHKKKALRSISRVFRSLGLQGEGYEKGNAARVALAIERVVGPITPDLASVPAGLKLEPFVGFSSYLECRVGTAGSQAELVLPFGLAHAFAALLPDAEDAFPTIIPAVLSYRAQPAIAREYANVVACELIICRSVVRCNGMDSGMATWIDRLRRDIARYAAGRRPEELIEPFSIV